MVWQALKHTIPCTSPLFGKKKTAFQNLRASSLKIFYHPEAEVLRMQGHYNSQLKNNGQWWQVK
jgi:hypothetical protein